MTSSDLASDEQNFRQNDVIYEIIPSIGASDENAIKMTISIFQ